MTLKHLFRNTVLGLTALMPALSAYAEKPLAERDIILMYSEDGGTSLSSISFNYIMRTGRMDSDANRDVNNDLIDWRSNDSFIRALKKYMATVVEKARASPTMQKLLHQPVWTRADRVRWERELAKIADDEAVKIPMLQYYRYGTISVKGPHLLNALADDIDHKTLRHRYVCQEIAIVRGLGMQNAENILLTHHGKRTAYKKAMNYYFAGDEVYWPDGDGAGHAFILSGALGTMINGHTSLPPGVKEEKPPHPMPRGSFKSQYEEPLAASSLETYVRGSPFAARGGTLYGHGVIEDHRDIWSDARKEALGLQDGNRKFSRAALLARQNAGCAVMEDAADGLIVVASRRKNSRHTDRYDVILYQKMDAGSPDEGYVNVRSDMIRRPANARVALKQDYVDMMNNKFFAFSADFNAANCRLTIMHQPPPRDTSDGQPKKAVNGGPAP